MYFTVLQPKGDLLKLTETMKVSFLSSDKSTTSSCYRKKKRVMNPLVESFKCTNAAFLQIKKCFAGDDSRHSGRWPGPAGVSGLPAGRGWEPSLHRSGSPEQWRWGCAARWRGTGGLRPREWFGTMFCRETRELISHLTLNRRSCLMSLSSVWSLTQVTADYTLLSGGRLLISFTVWVSNMEEVSLH